MTTLFTEAFSDTIRSLHFTKTIVENQINRLDDLSPMEKNQMVCYFPSTFICVVDFNQDGIKLANSAYPRRFTSDKANSICDCYTNGLGDKPVAIHYKEFYKLYLKWIDQQFSNMLELLRETA